MSIFFMLGYAVLALLTIALFGSSVMGAFSVDAHIVGVVKVALVALLLYQLKRDFGDKISPVIKDMKLEKNDLWNFIAVFLGTVVTFYLSIDIIAPHFETVSSAVLASGLVGILATLIFPKHDVPIFCGSFAGMASSGLLVSYTHVVLAGAIAASIFVLAKYSLNGFGGKLGTIAFGGCVFAALLTGQELLSGDIPTWDLGWLLVAYSVAGSVVTFMIAVRCKHSAVISSGIVGVFAAVVLPAIHADIGNTLSIMVFCASFAGMSKPERVPNELFMAISGVFCALIFMYTAPYMGGAGGKLGTTAFGSVICARAMINLYEHFTAPAKDTVEAANGDDAAAKAA